MKRMEVQIMLYVSIKDEEKTSYRRNAVVNELIIQPGAEDSENIKLDFTEDGKKLEICEVAPEDASKSDYVLVNRVGLYKGLKTDLDILFIDEETMLVAVNSGCVFLRSENVPNKKPTFALTRDAEAIENGEIDMAMMLDISGTITTVNKDTVHWVSAKDLFSLIKSSKGDSFGLHSDIFTMDYYYSVSITSSASWDKDRVHIQTGYKITYLDSVDLSYGLVDKYEEKMQKQRERAEKIAWDKHMEEQRKILQRAKEQSYYYDEDEDDELLYEMMEDEDF